MIVPSVFIMCPGSLIKVEFILTASHCKHEMMNVAKEEKQKLNNTVKWKVIIGATYLNPLDYYEDYQNSNYNYGDYEEEEVINYDFKITNMWIHPEYVQGKKYYDVAIIKLDQRAQLGQYDLQVINVVCLPSKANPEVDAHKGRNIYVTGYGKLEDTKENSNQTLSQIDLEIYPSELCGQIHQGGSDKILPLLKSELPKGFNYKSSLSCAHHGGRSTCFGDSGGPVMLTRYSSPTDKLKLKHFEQIGVVQGSYNIGCKSSGPNSDYPSIFTRLEQNEIYDFIQSKTDLSRLN